MPASPLSLEDFDLQSACAGILAAVREPLLVAGEHTSAGDAASHTTVALPPSPPLSTLEQWACASAPSTTQSELLDALAELLVSPQLVPMRKYADALCKHAKPILIDIAARVLLRLQQRVQEDSEEAGDLATAALYALALLLPAASGLYPLLCDFLQLRSEHVATRTAAITDAQRPAVLVALYRLTSAAPAIIDDAPLPLSSSELRVIALTSSADDEQDTLLARHLALQVYARVEDLAEPTVARLRAQYFGSPPYITTAEEAKHRQMVIALGGASNAAVFVEEIDPWLLPVDEALRRADARSGGDAGQAAASLDNTTELLNVEGTSQLSTTFGSHIFYRSTAECLPATDFKETHHSRTAIAKIGELLSESLPILLSGPEASGKSSLIRHACRHFSSSDARASIATLQLGDQTGIDAKSLIGSYVSSTTKPGTFEWVEGALTRAVRLGKWLVLKDIDRASSEILSVIKPLVEDMCKGKPIGTRPSLQLGGSRGSVVAKRGFALFATRSVRNHRRGTPYPQPTFLGWKHWYEAHMDPLSTDDVYEIVAAKAPILAQAQDDTIKRLVTTWLSLIDMSKGRRKASSGDANAGSQRTPSLHDLLKWCRRVEALIARTNVGMQTLLQAPFSNQALQEEIALEACDLFLGGMAPTYTEETNANGPGRDQRQTRFEMMLDTIASNLGVEASMLRHAMRDRKPAFRMQPGQASSASKVICIGRGQTSRSVEALTGTRSPSKTFAMTGPASRLMERICVGVSQNEALLLVGETGTGKTTVVQQLAALVNKPLIALNLSQQTETADLLGGFKPIDPKVPATDLHNIWVDLFQRTFSSRRNARYMAAERKTLQAGKWVKLHKLWADSLDMAVSRFANGDKHMQSEGEAEMPHVKARRLDVDGAKSASNGNSVGYGQQSGDDGLRKEWGDFRGRLESFGVQFTQSKRNMVFSFVEGPLIQAIQSGAWVLLDEINLATSETLESLSALLQTPESSLTLSERGDLEPVDRHPDFRLFACMNPATDVGKKDLPDNLRSRFTELYVPSPDADQDALVAIVEKYILDEALGDRSAIMDAAHCFVSIKKLARNHRLADGANQRPHYSVRTLSRALTFAKDTCTAFGLRRALYEGFLMAFTMLLDTSSADIVRSLLHDFILSKARNASSIANMVPPKPAGGSYIQLGSFWLEAGPNELDDADDYILTPSVQDKLVGLARAALTRRSPVLIQGPTSAGKTSAIEYLARRTGHTFIRINNHEHTDLQEYLGSYTTDPETGRLVFAEGLLVKAARHGHWVVLDELNLAPTDVLEALNRLLDDNRELVIPETNEVIRPHPHFMLFATQNPPGLYAGRKVLSRAFRNRFLEIHFDDVPQAELQTILARRCRIAPSYAERIVRIFLELQRRRQSSRVFDTKQAFATLRDLFRWGLREANSYEQLGINGYMLIAERVRNAEDAKVVQQVIEETLKIKLDINGIYDVYNAEKMSALLGSDLGVALQQSVGQFGIVWTSAMRRLVCLVACALRYKEPVLLVGETGTGKTSVCQVLAEAFRRSLIAVNCHQNTDASDLLGGQRPLRDREVLRAKARTEGVALLQKHGVALDDGASLDELERALANVALKTDDDSRSAATIQSCITRGSSLFEWHDGPLVQAMRQGTHFLLDEISLADDSVLERLNSVLEPERTLVLAEQGALQAVEALRIRADNDFQFVATMNPGGDYGKKELSPALRNRFTEVWVPQVTDKQDLIDIIDAQWSCPTLQRWSAPMVDFVAMFADALGGTAHTSNVGLRDLISWARFVDRTVHTTSLEGASMSAGAVFAHGAHMNFVDGLALHPLVASKTQRQVQALKDAVCKTVAEMTGQESDVTSIDIVETERSFAVGGFAFAKRSGSQRFKGDGSFDLTAPTPKLNAMRVLRALQVPDRAIMLEGSPGAGKTSLVVALARQCDCKLTRINLSDQTELSDLFGADLPVDGGKAGEFAWREAAFLKAMQEGSWVLLDEMNLASQSVLEGLNSCLDHRGQVYVPELDRSFRKHPDFRFFAAQNPQSQGGGRKGLPKSFLNRFTKVYVEELRDEDYISIMQSRYPDIATGTLAQIVLFNRKLQKALDAGMLSRHGRPWEFNLRDLLRWLDIMHTRLGTDTIDKLADPLASFVSLYVLRFRTNADRRQVARISHEVFGRTTDIDARPWPAVTATHFQIGPVLLKRHDSLEGGASRRITLGAAWTHLPAMQALGEAVRLSYPAILVGKHATGKTQLVRKLAAITGKPLREVRLNGGTDATDLIGGFEQVDIAEDLLTLLRGVESWTRRASSAYRGSAIGFSGDLQQSNAGHQLRNILDEIRQSVKGNQGHIVHSIDKVIGLLRLDFAAYAEDPDLLGICHRLRQAQQDFADGKTGTFGWKDGPFVQAIRNGDWVLLDEANLCSSSVLDRLNSVLEPNGTLLLSERGAVNVDARTHEEAIELLVPHTDFRVFFAVDPKYGELSRAMRNRGLEICIDEALDSPNQTVTSPSLPVQEGSLSALLPWARNEGAPKGAKQRATLHSLSADHIAIATPRYLASPLTAEDAKLVLHTSSKQKANFSTRNAIDKDFLRHCTLDLQSNDAFFSIDPETSTAQYSEALRLLLIGKQQALLVSQVKVLKDVDAPVLRKSLNYQQGQQVADFDSRDRFVAPFVQSTLALVEKFATLLLNEAPASSQVSGLLSRLSDHHGYLLQHWVNDKSNDASRVKVVLEWIAHIVSSLSASEVQDASEVQEASDLLSEYGRLLGEILQLWQQGQGQAMMAIWRTFRGQYAGPHDIYGDRILQLTESKRRTVSPQMIIAACEVCAALQHKPFVGDDEYAGLVDIAERTLRNLEQLGKGSSEPLAAVSENDAAVLMTLQLALENGERGTILNIASSRDDFTRLASANARFPLTAVVALKALQWETLEVGALSRGRFDWATLLREDTYATGAPNLFGPVLLRDALKCANMATSAPLEDLSKCTEILKRESDLSALVAWTCRETRVRYCVTKALSFARALLPSVVATLCEECGPSPLVSRLASHSELASELEFIESLEALEDAQVIPPSGARLYGDVVACYTAVGALDDISKIDDLLETGAMIFRLTWHLLNLYVPSIPLDPHVIEGTASEVAQYTIERLEAEIKAWSSHTLAVTGRSQSKWVTSLQAAVAQAQEAQAAGGPRVVKILRSPDLRRLIQLHSEMYAFTSQIVSREQMDQLATDRNEAHLRNVSATIRSVQGRMSTIYSEMADLTEPFCASLSVMQLAIEMLLQGLPQAHRPARVAQMEQVAASIVVQPSAVSSSKLLGMEVPLDHAPTTAFGSVLSLCLLAKLQGIALDVACGVDLKDKAGIIDSLYAQLWYLWRRDEEGRQRQKQEEASLYRTRKLDIEVQDDAELEEIEFALLFPTYSDVLDETDGKQDARTAKSKSTFYDDSELLLFCSIHISLFSSTERSSQTNSTSAYQNVRAGLIGRIMQLFSNDFSEELDRNSDALRQQLLAQSRAALDGGAQDETTLDFYNDAAPGEARKLVLIINRLVARLDELIHVHPDQFVLLHLKQRCEVMLRLSVSSPINRLLSALEHLLDHTEDWQAFANSKTSLQSHRDDIVNLIIDWRRKELNSWKTILQRDAERAAAKAHDFFMTLLQAVSSTDGDNAKELPALLSLLDQFLRGAPLGQYEARLDLVESMSRYVALKEAVAADETSMSVLLRNVVCFFKQFSGTISETISSRRAVIDKDIADYVKLASWKDTNVHALKASAAKTHRKLHKSIRKLRAVLSEGSDAALASCKFGPVLQAAVALAPVNVTAILSRSLDDRTAAKQAWHDESKATTPAHLTNLQVTARKLHELLESSVLPTLLASTFSTHVHGLTAQIIERSESLARETPATLTETNEKQVKNLETRKRKAWSELLKELRRVGLSLSTFDAYTAEGLADTTNILTLPAFAYTIDQDLVREADRLHFRIVASFPKLRSSLSSQQRNPDVDVSQLQRALSFSENAFTAASALRKRSYEIAEKYIWLKNVEDRLSQIVDSPDDVLMLTTASANNLSRQDVVEAWQHLEAALRETLNAVPVTDLSSLQSSTLAARRAGLNRYLERACLILGTLRDFRTRHAGIGTACLLGSEYTDLCQSAQYVEELLVALDDVAVSEAVLRPLCMPLRAWVEDKRGTLLMLVPAKPTTATHDSSASGPTSDRAISAVLVVTQALHKLAGAQRDDEELCDRAVPLEMKQMAVLQQAMRIEEICSLVNGGASNLALSSSSQDIKSIFARLLPFVASYNAAIKSLCSRMAHCQVSLLELSLVLCDLVTSLSTRGFCRPRQAEEGQANDEAQGDGEELEGGVGLGEGEGAKDVTDTLQDDEKMEELEGEKPESGDREGPQAEKNARETDNDLSGDAEDIEKDDDVEEEQEGEDEAEPEDAVGEVDPLDLNAVDEKTWSDDKKEDEPQEGAQDEAAKQDEGQDAGHDAQEKKGKQQALDDRQSGENAGQREAGDTEGSEDESSSAQGEEQDAQSHEENDEGEDVEDDMDDRQALGRAVDEQAQEGENLDIADDLNMDEEKESAASADDDSDLDMDDGDASNLSPGAEEQNGIEVDEPDVEAEEQATAEQDADALSDAGSETSQTRDKILAETEPNDASGGEDDEDHGEDAHDPSSAIEQTTAEETNQVTDLDNAAMESGDADGDATAQMMGAASAASGRPTDGQSAGQHDDAAESAPPRDAEEEKNRQKNGASKGAQSAQEAGEAQKAQTQQADAEQPRSLGDALKQFRRDLAAIEESLSQQATPEGQGPKASDESIEAVEHIDADDDSDMQALGAATEDDARQGKQNGILDDDIDPVAANDQPLDAEDDAAPIADSIPLPELDQLQEDSHTADKARRDGAARAANGAANDDLPGEEQEADFLDEENSNETMVEDVSEDVVEAAEELQEAHDEQERLEIAQRLWQLFSSITSEHSFSLSEQLRLILAPTKATKLSGDFRTGKRLNMRKMIAFVASDYVKDKIWLRRHLPHKREYQIMLCVDDSKSMSESENRILAYKSLALVCNALDRLEVGQVGVMKFGRDVQLLKGFEGGGSDTIGDAEGAKIYSNLGFDQRGTNVLHMMQQSLQILIEARETHAQGSGDQQQLWQLQLIISDGICQDHEGLRAVLRRAEEARIMVVFVIVDSLQQPKDDTKATSSSRASNSSSILTMSSAEYKPDASGRMQLHMRRYLDSFPFEYFVVVQDVADLPEILSTTLRQWAQRIAET